MVINHISFLLSLVTISVGKQVLYILSKDTDANLTKLDVKQYSGIQECIEACDIDGDCFAFGIQSRMNSDQINCFISNSSGSDILDSEVEIWLKPSEERVLLTQHAAKGDPRLRAVPAPL